MTPSPRGGVVVVVVGVVVVALVVIAVHLTDHPVFVPLPSVSNSILTLLVVDTITGGRVLPQCFFIKVLFFPSGLVSVIVRES